VSGNRNNERLHELWDETQATDSPSREYTTAANAVDTARLAGHVAATAQGLALGADAVPAGLSATPVVKSDMLNKR
jgi:hypothetical protein